MNRQHSHSDEPPATPQTLRTPLRGQSLLMHPRWNKGTAFTAEERRALGLEGLLPAVVNTMAEQVDRAHAAIVRKTDPLEQYIGLAALENRNEHLFYRLLLEHVPEFLPIVYTPTVGLACQKFSHIFRRPRGLWITPDHRGRIEQILGNVSNREVRLIVATDNERILGLGDQGAGGMGIPIGKLTLYTLAAGIHPSQTLPISLDVGTDNQELLDDPLYVGYRHRRLRGQAYESLVEEFVLAVQRVFPKALLQWEDFKNRNAFALLDRYRNRILSFNDDIQGTAAVVLAALLAAERMTDRPLQEQRILILGAGGAGIGIARLLRHAMSDRGMNPNALSAAIAVVDSQGLIHAGRTLDDATKREVAWPVERLQAMNLSPNATKDLDALVKAFAPTVLIGTTGQAGIFSESIVRTMADAVDRPIILPLSNPTSRSEAVPADLLRWTDGRAVIATGSPFDPVVHGGRTHIIGQANNVYIFPGVGLGALVAEATQVTDGMFQRAAETVAARLSPQDLSNGLLFPPLTDLRSITAEIAAAVVREARASGVGGRLEDSQIESTVASRMWFPQYPHLIPE